MSSCKNNIDNCTLPKVYVVWRNEVHIQSPHKSAEQKVQSGCKVILCMLSGLQASEVGPLRSFLRLLELPVFSFWHGYMSTIMFGLIPVPPATRSPYLHQSHPACFLFSL